MVLVPELALGADTVRPVPFGCPGLPDCAHCRAAEARWCGCQCSERDAHGCCVASDPAGQHTLPDGRRVCPPCGAAQTREEVRSC